MVTRTPLPDNSRELIDWLESPDGLSWSQSTHLQGLAQHGLFITKHDHEALTEDEIGADLPRVKFISERFHWGYVDRGEYFTPEQRFTSAWFRDVDL